MSSSPIETKPKAAPAGLTMTVEQVRAPKFSTSFRGFDVDEVRNHLAAVAQAYEAALAREAALRDNPAASTGASTAIVSPLLVDDQLEAVAVIEATASFERQAVEREAAHAAELDMVREGARADSDGVLAAARNEANAIVSKANDEAARIILRARAESRGRPSSEGMAVVESALQDSTDPDLAREQARMMIEEARAVRERILGDLARRRRVAHVQLEQMRVAREKLSEVLREARRTVDEASRDLSTAEVEARIAAEAAGRRVNAEPVPTVRELEAELLGARFPTSTATETGTDPTVIDDLDVASVGTSSGVEVEASTSETPPSETPPSSPNKRLPSVNVDDLFARLRSEREAAAQQARQTLAETAETTETPETPAKTPEAILADREVAVINLSALDTLTALPPRTALEDFDQNDTATVEIVLETLDQRSDVDENRHQEFVVGRLQTQLTRVIKRHLQDEQSAALAALRTSRQRFDLDGLLGAEAVHQDRLSNVVRPLLVHAAQAGAHRSNRALESPENDIAPLSGAVAVAIVSLVRADVGIELERLTAPEADASQIVDLVSGCYRRWTTDRLTNATTGALLQAYAVGRDGL